MRQVERLSGVIDQPKPAHDPKFHFYVPRRFSYILWAPVYLQPFGARVGRLMRGISVRRAALAVLFALCAQAGAAEDHASAALGVPVDLAAAILPDPDVGFGALPNGLHYAVMRSATPAGALSLRLSFGVGAFDEESGERGAAHFVEHMAFSGGQNAHEAGLETQFANAGVEFGRDQNARTDLFSTTYSLDLLNDQPSSLDLAFTWLRKVADGTAFSGDSVDRERAIILAERQVRLGPERMAQEDAQRLLTPGLRSTRPDTFGSPDELRSLTGTTLQNFYRRWYRPDNAFVVAVGDEPRDVLERRIRDAFGSWRSEGPKPLRVAFGKPDEGRGLDIRTRVETRLSARISVCRVGAAHREPVGDVTRLRDTLLTKLWIDILNRRLAASTKPDDAPFLSSEAFLSADLREARITCVDTLPFLGGWNRALRATEAERRRLSERAPTQQEIDDAIDTERARLRGSMRASATRSSSELASLIAEKQSAGDVVASPTEAFRAFDTALERVSPRDVLDAVARDWSGGGPLVMLSTEEPVSPDAVRRALDTGQHAPADEAARPGQAVAWAYTKFGERGRVAKRETIAAPEFVRVTFENGVVLNFKHTDFERDAVKVRVWFGAGRREIPGRKLVAAEFGSQLFAYMGLRRNDIQDMQELFSQTGWDATLQIGDDAFVLKGATSPRGLDTQLQILAAFASDPGFRESYNARIPTVMDYLYRRARSERELVARYALESAIGGAALPGLPPRQDLLGLRAADIARLFKPALTGAPLEVTIVGDVDETTATEYVAETFGALPARNAGNRALADTAFLRFPDRQIAPVRTTQEGPADVAVVAADWPLFVASPERRREEVSLMLLQKVFDNKLRHRIRQEMGKSYAPAVSMFTPDNADQGYIQALVETSPQDADLVRAEIGGIAARPRCAWIPRIRQRSTIWAKPMPPPETTRTPFASSKKG
jgi:zinc protease